MNEERFIKTEADPTTMLIAERLGERKRKLQRMAEMEKCSTVEKRPPLRRTIFLSAAAVLLAAMIAYPVYRAQMSPLDRLDIAEPQLTEFRAANADLSELAALVDSKDYRAAADRAKKAMERSDLSVKELDGLGIESGDDEMMYEEELEKTANSELRWTYIYILLRLNNEKEARRQLKIYLKDKRYATHRKEATALLEEIK